MEAGDLGGPSLRSVTPYHAAKLAAQRSRPGRKPASPPIPDAGREPRPRLNAHRGEAGVDGGTKAALPLEALARAQNVMRHDWDAHCRRHARDRIDRTADQPTFKRELPLASSTPCCRRGAYTKFLERLLDKVLQSNPADAREPVETNA